MIRDQWYLRLRWGGQVGLGLLFVAGLTPAFRAAAADCTAAAASLVGWWPGEGDASDIAGTNNGTMQGGGPTVATGVVGLAFRFDGTNNYVQIPDAPSQHSTNFTIEAWVRFRSLDSDQFLVFKQNSLSSGRLEGFDLSNTRTGNDHVFRFLISDTSPQNLQHAIYSSTPIVTDVWYHVAAVRGTNYSQLYVNGLLEGQATASFALSLGTNPVYFGTADSSSVNARLSGLLDEVSLYSRPLSSDEVGAIYAAGSAGKCKAVNITTQPQNQTVLAGTSPSFTVTATGLAPLNYQWRFNGTNLANASVATLTLTNVHSNYAGSYNVVVTNSLSSVTSVAATLTVVCPVVTLNPASLPSATVGTAYNQSLAASGGIPSYNFSVVAGALPSGLVLYFAGTLKGTPAAPGSNNFTVTATDTYGCTGSRTYALQVTGPAPTITVQPQSWTGIAGYDVSFSVSASGTPAPYYQWRKDGVNLGAATAASLLLPNVSTSDAGNYDVVASNAAGAATSAVARLVVGVVPDPQLRAALCCALSKTNCPCKTSPDLSAMSSLWACNYEITNLAGLEFAANLTNLSLAGNAISDLGPLTNLQHLSSLEVQNNFVPDLSVLTALTNLLHLTTGGNPINDYSTLSRLTNLVSLSVANLGGRGAAMGDLTGLENLTGLTSLILWGNRVTDILPVTRLTNLNSLDLRWNPITNQTALAEMQNLDRLFLGATALSNINFLAPLTGLTFLNLADNQISDLSPLSGLTNLSYLVLSGNPSLTNSPVLNGMSGLVNLELRGCGITNLAFLSNLVHLAYADLAYNHITDPLPLARPTNLSLVLDGNTNLDCVKLAGLTNISRIWLNDNSITNVEFLRTMPQLTALGLDNNKFADPSPLGAVTNLALLSLCQNSMPDYDWLTNSAFAGLASLRLEGNSISNNTGFLTKLFQLSFLSLDGNRVDGVSVLSELTNLSSVYLARNRLCDINPLTNLPQLRFVDASRNLLEANAAQHVANTLRCRWVSIGEAEVRYVPTDNLTLAVTLATAPDWHIPANRTRSLDFFVFDDTVPPGEWIVTAVSANESVIPNANISINGSDGTRTVTLSSSAVAILTNTLLAFTVQNAPCGLIATTNIHVLVDPPDPDFSLPDPSLSNRVYQMLDQPGGDLTSVDMLSLATLFAPGANIDTLRGLEWATNLTTLNLDNNAISDLTPLRSLWSLTSLSLYGNRITDLSPLTGLTNLSRVNLGHNPITNYTALVGLTNLNALYVADDSCTNLALLATLTGLVELDLATNKITDLSPLVNLTNLMRLSLTQNRLTNIDPLTNLLALSFADLRLNLLDVADSLAFRTLTNRGVVVPASPQREPPWIDVLASWLVAADGTSSIPFAVWDSGPADQRIGLGTNLVSSGLMLSLTSGTSQGVGHAWTLTVTPSTTAQGQITLAATNDVGLGATTTIEVLVAPFLSVAGTCPWLGDPTLNWSTGGDASWFGQNALTRNGQTTAQAGALGNMQESWLATSVVGPGRLTFYWRVSSEAGYDFLTFSIGNTIINRISGNLDWQLQVAHVPPGPQTLLWSYQKDQDNSVGLDAGWLAGVVFTPDIWLELAGAPTNSECRLILHGVPGNLYAVLASSDLAATNWPRLDPLVFATNFAMPFTDTNARSASRFYRFVDSTLWFETPARSSDGQVQLILHDPLHFPFELQVSSNLVSWSSLPATSAVFTATNTSVLTDPLATNSSVRFYRAVLLP